MVLALALAVVVACAPAVATFPYLAPPAGSDRHTSFAPLGDAVVAAITRGATAQERPAAPIALTASDGAGLALERVEIAAVIDGPLALTELHLTFRNPEPREREGRFAITLPPTAAVSRFAMKNETWREAEVVPRLRARQVYESYLHRKVDPALLERGAGNTFTARVFPIAASGRKELIVAYAEELDGAAPYRVRLDGLPAIGVLRWSLTQAGQTLTGEQRDLAPGDLELPGVAAPVALTAGDGFVARVVPPVPDAADPLGDLTILVDTSASRARVLHRQATLVRGLIAALPAHARVRVDAFDQGVAPVAAGRAAEVAPRVVDALVARGALGASDLGAALASLPAGGRAVVVTDGVATAGAREAGALGAAARARGVARLDVVTVGGLEDRAVLRALTAAGARGGAIVDGDRRDAAVALGRRMLGDVRVDVPGAAWTWPARLDGLAAGEPVVIAGRRAAGDGPLAVRFVVGGAPVAVEVPARAALAPLVARSVARAEIERLEAGLAAGSPAEAERAQVRAAVTELAVRHRLVTGETSLLVLETDADYARFCLRRDGLADLLTIAGGAVQVIARAPDGTTGGLADGCTPVGPGGAEPGAAFDGELTLAGATTIENEYLTRIPTGRTFDQVLGTAAGSQADGEAITIGASAPMIDLSSASPTLPVVPDHPRPRFGHDEPPAPPPPPPAYTGRFAEVMAHLRAGARDRALAVALAWQVSEPADLSALLALGEALEARGASALAARAYGSILDLWPAQVELVRAAAERLDRVGAAGRALALDAYQHALADRPDQITTHRLLAWALVRAGRFADATATLERAIGQARVDSVRALLRGELGVVGAAWARAEPAVRADLAARLARRGAAIADRPSLRVVLSWETDANDVDLHVRDRHGDHAWYQERSLASGGRLADDLTDGYGPEVFLVDGPARGAPYRISAHYYARGPMGLGLGTVQLVRHDGAGVVTVEDRPFVIMNDGAYADLGVVP